MHDSQERFHQIQNEIATQDTQSKSIMPLYVGKNYKTSNTKFSVDNREINKTMSKGNHHESDFNLQKIAYLKETYQ